MHVPPSFPRILAELTPADAALLTEVPPARAIRAYTAKPEDSDHPSTIASIRGRVGLAADVFEVHLDILVRLRLVEVGGLSWGDLGAPPQTRDHQWVALTALGEAFLRACLRGDPVVGFQGRR